MDPKEALEQVCNGDRVKATMKDGSRKTLTASWVGYPGSEDYWFGFIHRRREVLNSEIETVQL